MANGTESENAVANGMEIGIAVANNTESENAVASGMEIGIAAANNTESENAVANGMEIGIAAANNTEFENAVASGMEIGIAVASGEGENLSYRGGARHRVITAVNGSGRSHSSYPALCAARPSCATERPKIAFLEKGRMPAGYDMVAVANGSDVKLISDDIRALPRS
jgi:hypothetical protein